MDTDELGIHGDEVADALFAGVDLSNISQSVILESLLESPEDLMDLVSDKKFPMNRDEVLAFFFELQEDGLISEEFMIKEITEGDYSKEQVLEMLITTFNRMLHR